MDEENLIPQEQSPVIPVSERELPYNEEAENAVIGSILISKDAMGVAAELLRPEDFYFTDKREIYNAALELFNENEAIDFITVSDRLGQEDKLDAVGGSDYLMQLAASVPTTQHITYYSRIIREKAVLRSLIAASSRIADMAYAGNDETDIILERSEQLIFDVSSARSRSDIVQINEILLGSYSEMIENSQNGSRITGIATGYTELDMRTGGFHGGELLLIAGRPGMGKSSFAVNIAENVAIRDHKTVAIFNLEMPKSQIVNRIICSQSRVNSEKIRTGDFEPDDWLKMGEQIDNIAVAPLYIDDTATITVAEIRAKCRRLKQTKDLQLVVVDYLQLMQSSGRSDNRQQEISEISRSLKILAKELDVPVIALSQLSRASESRSDKRPMLSDLRESGAIEQDADMVMFLYRDEYYNKNTEDKGLAECIIAKNRNGSTGMFKLGWQGEYTKFVNVEFVRTEQPAG